VFVRYFFVDVISLYASSLNRATQDRYRYRARKQAADSSVGRLLTRAVAVPVSQCYLA